MTTFWKFIDKTPNKKSVTDEGALLGGRDIRVMDVRDLVKIWGSEADASAFVDRYLPSGIVQRGLLIIKCPFCRRADWYAFAELTARATCHKCSREFVYPADSQVYFKLDDIVTEVLRHDSVPSLVMLEHLRTKSEQAFLYSTATDVIDPEISVEKAWMEVDFMCLADGKFIVGECKSRGVSLPKIASN